LNQAAVKVGFAIVLVAFVACSSKRATSESSQATNEQTAAGAARSDGGDQSTTPSGVGAAPSDEEVYSAEITLSDGKVTKGDPSKVPWSDVSLICFTDCKNAPRDSGDTDMVALRDGRRKSGSIIMLEHSYNTAMHVWEGKSARVSGPNFEDVEDIPFSEIKHIKFTDHVISSIDEALRDPARAHVLGLPGDLGNDVTHLPSKLGKLTSLRELHIACMERLEDLPTELGNLRELEKLISDNGNGCQMNISLPESIGQLQKLRVLKLYGAMDPFDRDPEFPGRPTKIKTLPQTLANLENLEELDLGRNHNAIRVIPPQVASLHKLKRLALDFDDIRQVPSFIGDLKNLKELSLSGNHHRIQLPDSIAQLEGLKVSLGNNYFKRKDQELLRKRFPKIAFDFIDEFDDASSNYQPPSNPRTESVVSGGGGRTSDGWRMNWDQPDLHFTVDLKGKSVVDMKELWSSMRKDITAMDSLMSHSVDGVVLQIRCVAIRDFAKDARDRKLTDQAILAAFRDSELQTAERFLGEKLNPTSAEQQLAIGQALLWKYDKPKLRGLEQMYLTTVIGNNVVILNAVVERKSAESDVQRLLMETMSTLKVTAGR